MGEFNSDDTLSTTESLRRNGVAIMVNKRVQNAVLGCNLKNDRMISVHFQGKSFNAIIFRPQAHSRDVRQIHPSTENWIKDLLSMALP